jgi:hypothetical protein
MKRRKGAAAVIVKVEPAVREMLLATGRAAD